MTNPGRSRSTFIDRLSGAVRLRRDVYEDIEHDPMATRQAVIVVIGTSVLAGIAAIPGGGAFSLISITIGGIAGWAVYAGLAYYIGSHIFATEQTAGDWIEVARTVGFATAPRGLLIFGLIPGAYDLLSVVVLVWVLATTVTALVVALELSLWRAAATSLVAIIVQAIVFALIGIILAVVG